MALAPSRGRPSAPSEVARVTQTQKKAPTPSEGPEPLGVPAPTTIVGFQTEVFKELINKFAWALGSTYRLPYSNQGTKARRLATLIAKHVVEKQGYPEYMEK